ncbi:hypothetical protein VTI74DRAFT_1358 [Chaetomium olivicolor]
MAVVPLKTPPSPRQPATRGKLKAHSLSTTQALAREPGKMAPPTYYEILSLAPTSLIPLDEPAASALIKRAYRRALLNHHPDKTTHNTQAQTQTQHRQKYTIDQISTAYATLSRPSLRAAYDRSLALSRTSPSQSNGGGGSGTAAESFQTGIETVDLDDLAYDESEDGATTRWYRSCRCGNPRGYLFSEADLEDAADLGELMVGCADCSLWLRVHFAVVEDDDNEQENGTGRLRSE